MTQGNYMTLDITNLMLEVYKYKNITAMETHSETTDHITIDTLNDTISSPLMTEIAKLDDIREFYSKTENNIPLYLICHANIVANGYLQSGHKTGESFGFSGFARIFNATHGGKSSYDKTRDTFYIIIDNLNCEFLSYKYFRIKMTRSSTTRYILTIDYETYDIE